MFRVARLRKTLGPLSGGTLLEVLGEVGPDTDLVVVRLQHASKKFRDQIGDHPTWKQLVGEFLLAPSDIVFARSKTVEASRRPFKAAS